MNSDCPNCRAAGMEPFYEVRNIPAHSCLMFEQRGKALEYPRRDLVLGFCRKCGFISNIVFDPDVHEYAGGYEEQQSFSARFRDFQTDLCRRLIERYNVRGKDMVEIGCGKGDFLIELCELGGNRGVGIDPTCDPRRVEGRGEGRVRFIADFYSRDYADLPCDFLCCRHTLEHIHPTCDFIHLMREVVGDRPDMVVFFEVPGVERVLREQAFWDIYYEHCTYYSLGSLARVFRANRFDVVQLETDFDDQYLLIVATPSEKPTQPALPAEDDLAVLTADVQSFQHRVRDQINGWRERIQRWHGDGRRVAIWGSGSKCVSFLSTVGVSEEIAAIVDINPFRQGKWLAGSGRQVVAPACLPAAPPDVVLVMNPIYLAEIGRDLKQMGIEAELVAV